MPGRSKPTNRRFQIFLDGPFVKGEKGIAPIEKEFADRVAQFWMLYFLEEYKLAHANRVIGRAEYMNALNTFAKQDTMYFKSALLRRSLAQSKGYLTGHGPRQAQACFGTLPKEITTCGFHFVDRQTQIFQEADLLAVREYLRKLHSNPTKGGAAGTSPLFRSVKLFWAGVGCNPHTWKASAFKRTGGAQNSADVPVALTKHFGNIVNAVKLYAGLEDYTTDGSRCLQLEFASRVANVLCLQTHSNCNLQRTRIATCNRLANAMPHPPRP